MKIIHISDVHLGSPMTARLPAEKIRERGRELLDTLRRTVSEGIRLGARGVIIAGDLFDSENISERALDGVIDLIGANAQVTFFYLPGNHEGDALTRGRAVMPKNLLIFGREWTYFESEGLTVAGRSECTATMFDELMLDGTKKNIVVLHGELRDRSAAPDVIGKRDARGRGIDYLALGHYHAYKYEILDRRCTAVYCGTPEGRGFDETGDKGFVIIDTDTRHLDHRFIPFAKRRLHIAYADISTAHRPSDVMRAVALAVEKIPECDMVRAELTGDAAEGLTKDLEGILYEFKDRFYYFEVKDGSRLAIDRERLGLDKSLRGEFIRRVLAEEGLDERVREEIIACGIAALRAEGYFEI